MKEDLTGIVLSAATIGEYDKRVVLLTRENGRISAFARGARRPKSPLAATTEPMCFGRFSVYSGRDSYSIDEAHIDNFFPELKSDLDKLYMGLYFLEVADYFTREGMRAGAELELIYRSLLALSIPDIPDELIRYIYELRILVISGYSPAYDEEKKLWHDDIGLWKLSETASYVVGKIITAPLKELYKFSVSPQVLDELKRAIGGFFKRNTDKNFQTLLTLEGLSIRS